MYTPSHKNRTTVVAQDNILNIPFIWKSILPAFIIGHNSIKDKKQNKNKTNKTTTTTTKIIIKQQNKNKNKTYQLLVQ